MSTEEQQMREFVAEFENLWRHAHGLREVPKDIKDAMPVLYAVVYKMVMDATATEMETLAKTILKAIPEAVSQLKETTA